MNAAEFDATTAEWLAYQASPRGKLRSALLAQGLRSFVPTAPTLAVLDIGGGTGELALELVAAGHRVVLADYSAGMLALARDRLKDTAVAVEQVDLAADSPVLGVARYDLIVCHNVLEYVADTGAAFHRLARALKPGGMLSLAFGNAQHMPAQAAIVHGDLARALRELQTGAAESTNIFGTQTHVLQPERVFALLTDNSLTAIAVHGIRCVTDLMPRATTDAVDNAGALLALECALMALPAYRLLGRFVQVIARAAG